MDRQLAQKLLIALACCSVTELHCYDCPLWDNDNSRCRSWTDEEIVEAVRTLKQGDA